MSEKEKKKIKLHKFAFQKFGATYQIYKYEV